MVDPNHAKVIDDYITAFRKKEGFHEKTMDMLFCVAGSKEAIEEYGSFEKSFLRLIEIVNKYDDEQKVIDEFCSFLNLSDE